MGFEISEYFFSESAGFLNHSIYIVRENEATVNFNFTVTVVLLHDSTATDGRLHPARKHIGVPDFHYFFCVCI